MINTSIYCSRVTCLYIHYVIMVAAGYWSYSFYETCRLRGVDVVMWLWWLDPPICSFSMLGKLRVEN
jgi:hypothetical protein